MIKYVIEFCLLLLLCAVISCGDNGKSDVEVNKTEET